jgi:putative transposase
MECMTHLQKNGKARKQRQNTLMLRVQYFQQETERAIIHVDMKSYKTELDPNNSQISFFIRCSGAERYVYNWGLAEWKRQYEAGEKPYRFKLCKQFNAQKDTICPWVRDVPYAITESAFLNLGLAFNNFFRRVKQGSDKVGYPKFKNCHQDKSFQIRNASVENDRVRITGIGWVSLKERFYIPSGEEYGRYATISERAGRWYISVLVKTDEDKIETDGSVIGVDIGIKSLAVCSDGTVYESPRPLNEAQSKLSRLQRELARRQKGGSNRHKSQVKLQRQFAEVSDLRDNALHNISHDIIYNKHPSVVVIEDLNVQGMMMNHHLANALSDSCFGELRRQIEYKAKSAGVQVIVADRWFPSSKTCNVCGCIKDDLTLADREFVCECGNRIDRDLNAALNLAAYGRTANRAGIA